MYMLSWILVLALGSLSQVHASGILKIQLLRYTNSDGRDAEGDRCDTTFGIKTSDCDPFFQICVKSVGSGSCNLYSTQTSKYTDQDTVTFGTELAGGAANPINLRFTSWPAGGIQIAISVYDEDTQSGHDLLEDMLATVNRAPDAYAAIAVNRDVNILGTNTLTARVMAYCEADWYGDQCDTYCVDTDDTTGHYTCSDTGQHICIPGWEGTDCSMSQNECASNPCINGDCIDEHNSFSCQCTEGFIGALCDVDIDECLSEPCLHGSTCLDDVNGYTCACVDGFQGDTCDEEIDYCLGIFCDNGGSCEQTIGNTWCACAPGFTGQTCGTNIDDCDFDPCEGDDSACIDLVNDFRCECGPQRTGPTCSDVIQPPTTSQPEIVTTEASLCALSPCGQNGTCMLTSDGDGYICFCPDGTSGLDCSPLIVCDCDNGGSCEQESGLCVCPSPWTGEHCDVAVRDDCDDDPCLNMGECMLADDGFLCICSSEYTGERCEIEINPCDGAPCQNGGSCEDSGDGYKCTCTPHFSGDHCQHTDYTEDPTKPQVLLFVGGLDSESAGQLEVSILELVAAYHGTPTSDYRLTYDTHTCLGLNDTRVTVVTLQVLDDDSNLVPWYTLEEIFGRLSPDQLRDILPRPLYDGGDCSAGDRVDEFMIWPIVVGVVAAALVVGIIAAVVIAYKKRKSRSGGFDVITNPAYDQDRRGTTDTLLSDKSVEQTTQDTNRLPVYFRSHSQEYPGGTIIDLED